MSFLSSIIKSSSQSVAAGLVSAVGSFAASVIVARLLGVPGTATVTMALWIVFLTFTLADIGITGTLARFIAERSREDRPDEARDLAAFALRVFLLAVLGGAILGALFLWFYWADINAKYASGVNEAAVFCGLVMLCFVVHMLNAFAYQFLRGQRAFKEITAYSFAGSCLQILGVAVGSLTFGANGALLGYILFSLPMLWSLRRIRLAGAIRVPPAAPRMRSYAIGLYFSVLFSPLLWVRADFMIVDQMLGASAVGLFAAAATVAALMLQVCQMICNALLPNIVHAGVDDRANFEMVSRTAVRMALTLLWPACLIGAAVAPEAVTVLFGPAFAASGTTAAILCIATTGSALTLIVSSVLNADEANAALVRNGIIGAIVTVAGGVGFVLLFGLIGAAVGRLLAQGVVGLLNARSANQRVSRLVTIDTLARIFIAGLAAAAITEGIGRVVGGGLVGIILSLIAGGLFYILTLPLLVSLGQDERARLAAFLDKRPEAVRRPANWLLQFGRRDPL